MVGASAEGPGFVGHPTAFFVQIRGIRVKPLAAVRRVPNSFPAMTNPPIAWGKGVARRIGSLAPLALALAGGGGAATPPPAA